VKRILLALLLLSQPLFMESRAHPVWRVFGGTGLLGLAGIVGLFAAIEVESGNPHEGVFLGTISLLTGIPGCMVIRSAMKSITQATTFYKKVKDVHYQNPVIAVVTKSGGVRHIRRWIKP
jgi:hypothetical protein